MTDPVADFTAAMRRRGITPPAKLINDGKLHRCDVAGRGGKDDAAYLLYPDGIPAGGFQNWRDGLGWEDWRAAVTRRLSPAEETANRSRVDAARREREADEAARHLEAGEKARRIWDQATPAAIDHPYLIRKRVKPHGIRQREGRLVIPLRDAAGCLKSLQFIAADGTKRYLTGGQVRGCYHVIGIPNGTLCIAEGYATCASVYEATGHAVAVAFDAGNLLPAAEALSAKFSESQILVCADDDYRTKGNPGMAKATEAAKAVGGLLAIPDFGMERPEGATDFNDLHQQQGAQAVATCIENGTACNSTNLEWPDPLPLVGRVEAEPYPLDALPDTIRAAVEEVQAFTKAPMPLVVSSALAALSLAVQAHVDVKRADKLTGPVALFLLTIADSGERKSTHDSFFTAAIRDYEREQAELAKPEQKRHAAQSASWEAEREGILSAIKQAAKSGNPRNGKSIECLRADLSEQELKKPEPPRVPRLMRGDDTPENLAWVLSREFPSAGVLSAEAGIVFGAHGMGKDSIMRNLGLLNLLWDGGELSIGRRTSESFTVRGARLTVGLQVQEATLRSFFDRSGGLARGTGFLARFLVAWPESTQGYRPFTDPPGAWPSLATFNRRITEILNVSAPVDEEGALVPPLLSLAPAAKAAWVTFHDAIEGELRTGGELYDVRDVASKSADNAARLAALFNVFEHGMGGAVELECLEGASRIAAWHLNESRRFFGELVMPAELANAARLDTWLIDFCRRNRTINVPTKTVQQFGPSGLREKSAIDAAMSELEEHGRARVVQEGRRKTVKVNPALTRDRCGA